MMIWRPIMGRLCTLEGVLSGEVGIEHLIKLNALMDAQNYQQASMQD